MQADFTSSLRPAIAHFTTYDQQGVVFADFKTIKIENDRNLPVIFCFLIVNIV